LLLIVDDAISSEGLSPFIAGLGPQVVALITTQQGAEIRAEVERWLPADAVMEVGVDGLAPTEGRELVEAVAGRPLADTDWGIVQEIGDLVGWHPEALRLAAIEGREIGWKGMLDDLKAGRMPWNEVRRLVMRQWARLHADQQDWLSALVRGAAPGAWLASDEAARFWQVEWPVAERRLWFLQHGGLVERMRTNQAQQNYWRIAPAAHPILTSPACR